MRRSGEGSNQDANEPEPIDPKLASRLIGRHIQLKKDTELRARTAEDDSPPPPTAPEASALMAVPFSDEHIVELLQESPEFFLNRWVALHTPPGLIRAAPVSLAEIDFLVGRPSR